MKTFLHTLIVLSSLLMGSATGESLLTKEQVVQMGRVILAAPANKEYKDVFWDQQPSYNAKTKLWVFSGGFPVTPGGQAYIFEIREADGLYRLVWWNGQKQSPGFERFSSHPSIRKKLADMMKKFRKQ